MKRFFPLALLACATCLFLPGSRTLAGLLPFGPATARAGEAGWKLEYEMVCSKTDLAMAHTTEELKALIARCDRLKSRIEAEDESTRKVYLRRLQLCRDLYKYVLDSKQAKP